MTASLLAPLALAAPAEAGSKVVVCHRTASMTNPYRLISVRQSAVNAQGHGGHGGGVWTPAWDKATQGRWGDIITGGLNDSGAGHDALVGLSRTPGGKAVCGYLSAAQFYAVQSAAGVPEADIMADLQDQEANEDAALLAALGGSFTGKTLSQLEVVRATTAAATDVGPTSAALSGTISVGAKTATMSFVVAEDAEMTVGRRVVAASPASVTGDAKAVTATVAGLTAGTDYHYRTVGTVDAGLESEGTVEGPVVAFSTTGATPQSVTFEPLADATYGGPAPVPDASASSGLPVVLTSATTGTCTVTGTTVSLLRAGLCTLVATQAGSQTYVSASASRSFTIARAAQAVTLPATADRSLGSGSVTVVPSATSGLAPVLGSTSPHCTVSGTTVALVSAGTCTLTADQAGDDRYLAAARATAGFEITGAAPQLLAQTIDLPTHPAVELRAATTQVSASATSGLPVALASASPAVCTVGGSTVMLRAVGLCVLTADQPGNGTYAAAPQVGTSFLVTRAPQTVSVPAAADRTLRSGPVTVVPTATSGLVAALSSTTPDVCTVLGTVVTPAGVGTCTLAADQAGDGTWLAALQATRSLQVRPDAQTLTLAPLADATVGDDVAITAAASSGLPAVLSTATPLVCRVGDATVTMLAPGACTVVAAQPGDATWLPAEPVTRTSRVSARPQVRPVAELPVTPAPSPSTADASPAVTPSPSVTPAPSVTPSPSPSRTASPAGPVAAAPSPKPSSARPSTATTPAPAPRPLATAPAAVFRIDRRDQVPVPATPPRDGAPAARTTATLASRTGVPAPPVAALKGLQLRPGQAATLSGRILFDFNSPVLTRAGLAEVTRLVVSLQRSSAVVCEGYADYGGAVSHEQQLSAARAKAVCATISRLDREVRGASIGYGHVRPVVVGGTRAQRAENRRVVVVVQK